MRQKGNGKVKVKVNTLWRGRVALRDWIVRRAVEEGTDLIISHNHGTMTIPNEEIDSLIVGKSASPVPDKFSNEFHFLIYFRWLPTNCQLSLWGGESDG